MKRRQAMLLARNIADTILSAVVRQGKGKAEYTLSHEQMKKISADALDVAEYLVVPRPE